MSGPRRFVNHLPVWTSGTVLYKIQTMSERRSKKAPTSVDEWRTHISKALYHCVRKNGYAFTSLNTLAAEAGMSASHLRYYFGGKEAVLEFYVEQLCAKFIEQLDTMKGLPPTQRIDALAEFCFGEKVSPQRLGVLQEIFALTIHHPRMRRMKSDYDAHVRTMLAEMFAKVKRAPGLSVADAARLGHALVEGFLHDAVFDSEPTLATPRRLFRETMRTLAGLPVDAK